MKTSKKSTIVAAGLAIGMLILCGVGYRILAEHLARPMNSDPLPPGTLDKLPMVFSDWTGRDVPMDKAIIKATNTDALLNRSYSRRGGTEAVGLYIAYGVKARDLMPHRPEVCYPGSGWTMDSNQAVEVRLAGHRNLPCRVYRFGKNGLAAAGVIVLNFYIVDGEFAPDVSLLRSKAWRGQGGIHYMAQVQITMSDTGSAAGGRDAAETLKAFAAEVTPSICSLLPHGEKNTEHQGAATPSAAAKGGNQ